ncbi:MAG: cellulase family glycosylhydrolase [Verrucomicrobia bacterium]|nr:cellulase family glycosylhydrolase [Verrucomicrobiota bacterium]
MNAAERQNATKKRNFSKLQQDIMTVSKILSIAPLFVASAFADDRLGVNTHFDQGWNPYQVMPLIPAAGFGWIRDDLSWGKFETIKGQYKLPQSFINWVTVAEENGLKVDLCLAYGNSLYADPYDVTAYSNAAAWVAAQLKAYPAVQAIEILNEPNNAYFQAEGSNWKQKYVTLLNSSYTAIKTVYPAMTVIGLGAQADDDFVMMSYGANADGLTAHPYPVALPVPESVYEPSYYTFTNFSFAWLQHDIRPRWDTEWGCSTGVGTTQYTQALFIARRLCQSLGDGVSHNFIYDFQDDPNQVFGVVDAALNRKQSYQVVQRLMSLLSGMVSFGGVYVDPSYSDSAFDYADFYAYTFQNGGTSVAVAWTGNSYPSQAFFTSHKGRLSFTHPAPTHSLTEVNAITGETHTVSGWEQYGNEVVMYSAEVTNEPVLYIAR